MEAQVYSSPHCGFCKQAINYLREIGVKVKIKDIARNLGYAEELMKKTGQTGVPVIYMKGKKIVGFDKNRIDRILGIT